MAQALADQLEHPERYGELEFTARLRAPACVEDIDFRRPRGLDRTQILALAESRRVVEHRYLVICGATGCGKTFLACALAQAAIRRGHKALYWRVPRLLDELRLAHADGRAGALMSCWARVDVLVLGDLYLRPLTAAQAANLLEVIEDRHQRRSTSAPARGR
jgi:DNA replication protein DnaC